MRSFKLTDLRLLACLLKLSCWHKLGILPIIPELDVEPSDLQELFHDTHEGCSGWVAELTAQRQQIARLGRGGGLVYSPIQVRRNVGYLSYPREEESRRCRVTLHTVQTHMPSASAEKCLNREETAREDREGGTTQGDSLPRTLGDSVPTFPPLTASTRRELPACELRDARPPVLKLVDRLRAAQLKMRAGRRCHPPKTARAGNSNEPCCSFLPARGAVVIVPCG